MDNSLIDNLAKVKQNQTSFVRSSNCERVLGGKNNLVRAAVLGLHNSDLLGLITTYLTMNFVILNKNSSEINGAYMKAYADLTDFLLNCVEENNKQQPDTTK